jgi:hypothetical protein
VAGKAVSVCHEVWQVTPTLPKLGVIEDKTMSIVLKFEHSRGPGIWGRERQVNIFKSNLNVGVPLQHEGCRCASLASSSRVGGVARALP